MTVERLERLLEQKRVTGDDAVVALGLLGDAFDRLGQADAAFAAYASAKARLAARGQGHSPIACSAMLRSCGLVRCSNR